MKLKELKNKINSFPSEFDDYDVVFGQSAFGEKLNKLKILGRKIILSFF